MRHAATVMLVGVVALSGCNDVRDFAGTWQGERVRDWPPATSTAADHAELRIDTIDKHGLRGSLAVHSRPTNGLTLIDTTFSSLEAAEGDVLSTMTFAGDPLRVYLAFVPTELPSGSSALAIISLYDSQRIELRVLKGEPDSVYAIFALGQ